MVGVRGDVPLNADAAKLNASLAALAAKVAALGQKTSHLQLDANTKAIVAKIAAIDAQISHLGEAMGKMEAEVDITAASTKILALDAQARVLRDELANLKLKADTTSFHAQLVAAQAELEALTKERDINIGVDIDTGVIARASAALAGLFTKADNPAQFAAGWGIFGRALNGITGNISLLHVALDATLEAVISIGTAAAAAAIGIAAMEPAAENVALQLQAIDTVNEALGNQIPALSRQFDALTQSLAPQVIEAFGGALDLVNQNSGVLEVTARKVVTLIDDWVAELDVWAKSQNAIGGILQTGVGFLSQFATIFAHLGEALLGLLKANPGTAEFLLSIVDGFAKILDWASKLPAPLLQLVLLFASIHTWANVLGGVLSKMPGLLGNVGAALVKLLSGPTGLVVIALTALAVELGRAWDTSSVTVAKAISSINAALDSMTTAEAFFALPAAIGALNDQLKAVNSGGLAAIEQNWTGLNDIWQRSGDKLKVLGSDLAGVVTGSTLHELESFGNFFKDLFTSNAGDKEALVQEKQDVANLNDEINKLLGNSRNLDAEIGSLGRQGFNFTQALALMSLAGVQVNDSFALMAQKVDNLIKGYEAISVRGGILANSVNAITFAAGLQETKVTDLNSAWDTFISTVTGSESSFASVENDIEGLFSAAAQGGAHLTDSNGKVSSSFGQLAGSAGKAKVSFSGLDTTSLSLQQTFDSSVTGANALLDSLTLQATAAGLGQKGTNLLAQATKDLIIQLLPAASGSKTLTAELYALAQRGGFTGADSFKALSAWVGKTKDPMQSLQGVVQTFTVASAGLTTDVQNLSVALGTTLAGAMSTAVFLASGGQKSFTDFAKAVLASGGNLSKVTPSAKTLADQLIKITGNTADAEKEFDSFAIGALHLTKTQADALWKSVAGGSQTMAQAAAAVTKSTTSIAGDFKNQKDAAGVAKLGVDLLTASIALNGVKSDATKNARAALIADMVKAGVNATVSQTDVDKYTAAVAKNGATSDQAQQARQRLIADILKASNNAVQGQLDMTAFTTSVETTGNKSDATRSARQRLIQDLENSGLSAKTATGLVDGLQRSIDAMHGKTVTVGVIGTGSGDITISGKGTGVNIVDQILLRGTGFARGGQVGGSGNHDTVPAMLTPGELVVPKGMVAAGAVDHLRGKLPGFAGGGLVGMVDSASSAISSEAGVIMAAQAKAIVAAETAAIKKAQAAQLAKELGGPLGVGTSAGEIANGRQIYNYLLNNLFGGTKIAAAGATASIWGESNWDPFAQGTGGRGLIGWTPPSTISNTAFAGGMATQLPAILKFVVDSGDLNVIAAMDSATSVLEAANEWGVGVERFGINDVHPEGVALATSFMARGGMVPGYASGGLVTDETKEKNAFAAIHSAVTTSLAHPAGYFLTHKTSLTDELATLVKRQAAEQTAYAALSGKGLTKANLSKFATQARDEIATTKDKFLSTAEPSLDKALAAALTAVSTAGSAPASPAAATKSKAASKAASKKVAAAAKSAVVGMNGGPLTHAQYLDDAAEVRGLSLSAIRKSPHLEHVWHLLHLQHLADVGMANGGMVFDRGGTLAPGPNLVWNHTGKPEHVTPDGGGGAVTVNLHVHGPVGSQAELARWLKESVRELVRVKGGGNVQRAFGRP